MDIIMVVINFMFYIWNYRQFKVRLKRDNHVFHPDVIIESSHGPLEMDTSFLYTGVLQGKNM